MVPEEWPILLPAIEPASHARAAGCDRLSAAMADFFLDPAKRLTEQERALVGSMLDGLIEWIADQIISALPSHETPANDCDGHALRQALSSAGLLQRRDLMAILLRSADEERIAAAARSRFVASSGLLQRLISNSDAGVSAAAMELILARGKRRDRFGQLRLDFDDLSERLAAGLAQAIAAALRGMTLALGGDGDTDRALSEAATALVGGREGAKAIEALTGVLIDEMSRAGLLDEAFLEGALREGDIRLVVHGLARQSSIDAGAAWTLLTDDGDYGAALLLRMAGATRTFAAQLIATVGDQIGIADPASGIRAFDSISDDRVAGTRSWMQLDPAYRSAAGGFGRHG